MHEWRPLVEHTCWRCKAVRKYAPAEVVNLPRDHGPAYYVRCGGCKGLTPADKAIHPK